GRRAGGGGLREAPDEVDRPVRVRGGRACAAGAGRGGTHVCGRGEPVDDRGPAVIPTPPIELRPILPELLLCVFAIAGMLYEAFPARSSRLVPLPVAPVRSS